MHRVVMQCPLERMLPKQDQLRKTLFLHRSDPAFRKRVQIRTMGRQGQGFHFLRFDQPTKRCAVLAVTIVQQISAISQKPSAVIRQNYDLS
jgi:hypothetical protein